MSNNAQNFLARVEQGLVFSGLSKGDLAARVGVSPSTVSRWNGAIPHAKTISKVSEILGVNANWLLTGEGPQFPPESQAIYDALHAGPDGALRDRPVPALHQELRSALEWGLKTGRPSYWKAALEILSELEKRHPKEPTP